MSPPVITVVSLSIGPVQEFIQAARRTRDFAFGSALLVHLARRAAELIAPYAAPLIFPAQPQQDAPNKLVFVYNGASQVAEVMQGVEANLRQHLEELMQHVAQQTSLNPESTQRAVAQVRDLLEFYWGYGQDALYAKAYEQAEHALQARKSLRDFGPMPMNAALPKSSLTGTYESVIPEELQQVNQAKQLLRRFRARPSERLSGVDLLKRRGKLPQFDDAFPSIAEMTARSALMRSGLLQVVDGRLQYHPEFNEAWRAIDREIDYYVSDAQHDGRPYHQSAYRECIFEARLGDEVVNAVELNLVTHSVRQFVKQWQIKADKPYFAMLLADGDRMGQAISACLQATNDYQAHVAFSQALSTFAQTVKGVITRHAGVPIYTGGDDVLAMVPVTYAIACAEAIQALFAQQLQPLFDQLNQGKSEKLVASVSVGIVIAHHMHPLSEIMEAVRRTEQHAKRLRSALAVCASKRSGGEVTVVGHWGAFPARMQALIKMLQSGDLPDGYAYELRDLLNRLRPQGSVHHKGVARNEAVLGDVLDKEALRILKRKKNSQSQPVNEQHIIGLLGQISEATYNGKFGQMNEWVNEIIVARELM